MYRKQNILDELLDDKKHPRHYNIIRNNKKNDMSKFIYIEDIEMNNSTYKMRYNKIKCITLLETIYERQMKKYNERYKRLQDEKKIKHNDMRKLMSMRQEEIDINNNKKEILLFILKIYLEIREKEYVKEEYVKLLMNDLTINKLWIV